MATKEGWRESKGGGRGSRRGAERHPERPRTRDGPDRRLDRGRGESGITEAELRVAMIDSTAFPRVAGGPTSA